MPKSREELEAELAKQKKHSKLQMILYMIMLGSSVFLLWNLFA